MSSDDTPEVPRASHGQRLENSQMKRILGYSDKLSVRPCESIEFKISGEEGTEYQANLVRLINGDTHSTAAGFREVEIDSPLNGVYKARKQLIFPGSCVVVDTAPSLSSFDGFTLALALLSTTPNLGLQHLISQWDNTIGQGWSVHLDTDGRLAFTVVDALSRVTTIRVEVSLLANSWYRAAVRVNWISQTVALNCIPLGATQNRAEAAGSSQVGRINGTAPDVTVPLLMAAAFNGRGGAGVCNPVDNFNGRLEAPVIYRKWLCDVDLVTVLRGDRPALLEHCLVADWDFSLQIDSPTIRDRSPNRTHGYTHNLPLRGVKGSHWDGSEISWRHAPSQYGAIHFHKDDIYDCGWETDIQYEIPAELRSGIYALRLRLRDEPARTVEDSHEEYIPFFVAATKGRPQAELAFLVPTYTYIAYGNVRVQDSKRAESGLSKEEYYARGWRGPGDADYSVILSDHPELGNSTYDYHLDGSPVHTSSWLRPLLGLRPKSTLWTFCADLLLIDWLEAKGVAYDVITDDLLHKEGVALLKSYRVVVTGNHPEYQTTVQLGAIGSYLSLGGRLMYMGGNGFYWRCAVNEAIPAVIEVRRGRTGTRIWTSDVGEDYLSFTGELGGIWRDIGRPPQALVGVGFIAEGRDDSYFRVCSEARTSRAGFALQNVQDIVGRFGVFGSAVGQEIDRTNRALGTPEHAVVLARSENHNAGMVYAIEEMNPVDPVLQNYLKDTYSEIVFFETPGGGAVFSVGSMTWFGSLGHNRYDNDVSTITWNVMARMLDPKPFDMP